MVKIGNKKYIDLKDYAKREGVTLQTVYNRIKSGDLKTKKILDKQFVEL